MGAKHLAALLTHENLNVHIPFYRAPVQRSHRSAGHGGSTRRSNGL
jgi:hypothetical protein